MKYEGIWVHICDNDADATNLKESIYSDGESVNIVADDTGILRLLLTFIKKIMTKMKITKSSGQHVIFSIQFVVWSKFC